MKLSKPRTGKISKISVEIRDRIIGGAYGPGGQLPTRAEMIAHYGVSSITINEALARLINDGFVRADGRRGTFVADQPPHLNRFALVLSGDLTPDIYEETLCVVAERLARRRGLSIDIIKGGPRDRESLEKLVSNIQSRRLAGVIFSNHPFPWHGSSLLDMPGVARIAISRDNCQNSVLTQWPDYEALIKRAFAHFLEIGRRSVAVLTHASFMDSLKLIEQLCPAELRIEPYWVQAAPLGEPLWAKKITELLGRCADARPDALLVLNDNLTAPAVAGLEAAGLKVPEDVAVLAHANYPRIQANNLPVRTIGFRIDTLLERCVDRILANRNGQHIASHEELAPVFDNEVTT